MEQNEIKDQVKKEKITSSKRIGSFTFGVIMILFGICIFLQTFTAIHLLKFMLALWPLVFILLGTETLYYSTKKNIHIKYDILGVITIFVILFFGVLFSIFNYGVNKVLYNEEFKQDLIYLVKDNEYHYTFSDYVKVESGIKDKVVVKFIEDKAAEQVSIFMNVQFNEQYEGSFLRFLKDRNVLYKGIDIRYSTSTIAITSLPPSVDRVEIVVTTNSKDNIRYSGSIIE